LVTYCKTHDHSWMGVQSNRKVYTYFDVPSNLEVGKYDLEVVVNGVASERSKVEVKTTPTKRPSEKPKKENQPQMIFPKEAFMIPASRVNRG